MKKKVTPTVCERIQFIKNRIKEILVDMLPENKKEYGSLLNEFDSIRGDYDLFDSVFEENGKTGVVDVTGRIIVPAIYKDCPELFAYTPFESLPMAVCNFEDKYALVAPDGLGTQLCGFEYDYISYLRATNSHYMCVKKSGDGVLKGILDGKGRLIVPCEMDKVYEYAFNFTPFEKDGKYGCITDNGTFVPPLYDELEAEESWLKACKDGVWGYIAADCSFIPEDDEDRYDSEDFLSLYCEDDDCL